MKKILVLAAGCALLALGFTHALAADAKPSAAPAKAAKVRAIPYRGELKAIDQKGKTFTIGERVFLITSETKIKKGETPATTADLKVGDQVTGQYKDAGGKLEAVSVYLKEPGKASADKKGKTDEKKK